MVSEHPKKMHIWVNPPETAIPLTTSPVRVAVGTPSGASTNSWRVWVHRDDVYVVCRDNFRELKVSLHASGRWRLGFTEEFIRKRPDAIPSGVDRAWTKWQPDLSDPTRAVIGVQIVTLVEGLYLNPRHRRRWPDSVVFVEPRADPATLTVLSVTVVRSLHPVRIPPDSESAVIAVLPLGDDRTVQLVATYDQGRDFRDLVAAATDRVVAGLGGFEELPTEGVMFFHGVRGELPWVTAVPLTLASSADSVDDGPAEAAGNYS